MSALSSEKYEKADNRAKAIKAQLNEHYENIKVLQSVLAEIDLKPPQFDTRNLLPKNKHTFEFTINNLNKQISELQYELGILNEYCLEQ